MKSQTSPPRRSSPCSLAREGWRPARGDLLVICVSDEEEGGTGAEWLTAERPDLARCDYLLNEGAGASFALDGGRAYEVSVGEKGVFRITLTTDGVAGHASTPAMSDNALLKLAPLLAALADARHRLGHHARWTCVDRGRRVQIGLRPARALAEIADARPSLPRCRADAARHARADDGRRLQQMNVIPEAARLHVDCRTPPGMEEAEVAERVRAVLGDDGYGSIHRVQSRQRLAARFAADGRDRRWIGSRSRAQRAVPTLSIGFSDSRTFRAAFPDCVAYGFFPQRYMSYDEVARLPHARDERIDVRDVGLAVDCYRAVVSTCSASDQLLARHEDPERDVDQRRQQEHDRRSWTGAPRGG